MSVAEKLPLGTLCVVCEDTATGNHYSVPSCNGCKTFFRRALVNNRNFICIGDGNCPVNKSVRCACRSCRLAKCLAVGMNKNSIQNDRDRIGYTKRTRKNIKKLGTKNELSYSNNELDQTKLNSSRNKLDDKNLIFCTESDKIHNFEESPSNESKPSSSLAWNPTESNVSIEPMLERLTQLENNFSLLLSRDNEIVPYASLDEALAAPSRFSKPLNVKMTDPVFVPISDKMPYWRSRIIALYIDWAKTFTVFRKLPYSDKIALITNHASSYVIMCEAFRTLESNSQKIKESLLDFNDSNLSDLKKNFDDIFDDENIKSKNMCSETEQVPPLVHYPTIGSLSGLTPIMTALVDCVIKPFRKLNITTTEFATLQAIMFLDPDTEALDAASQRNIFAEQKKMITALYTYISANYEPEKVGQRFSLILLRIPTIRKIAAKKNESLQIIDMCNFFNLSTLIKETALGKQSQDVYSKIE